MTAKIRNLRKDADGRYIWESTDINGREGTFFTNPAGDGLFIEQPNLYSGETEQKQLLGTDDFTLVGPKTMSGVRQRIRRLHND